MANGNISLSQFHATKMGLRYAGKVGKAVLCKAAEISKFG